MVYATLLIFLCQLCGLQLHAQSWLPGYNYRKKITINKAMVSGNVDLQDFQLLVVLEHSDLRYVAGACTGNKLSGTKGRDFAFTTVAAPQTPLSFQLDEYVPATGRLVSWVRLSSLAAASSSSAATQIYLYYGSNILHFPAGTAAEHTWNGDQDRVWHMNPQVPGLPLVNGASSLSAERLTPSASMNASNIVPGKIGNALLLNGSNQYLTSSKINSTNFLISCWIKFTATNREQVILSTDSADFGGYSLKLGTDGRLVQETRSRTVLTTRRSVVQLVPDRWYHVVSQSFQGRRDLIVDGVSSISGLGNTGVVSGGSLIVGCSKQQNSYFGGQLDELRIQTLSLTPNWQLTSYNNQRDPAAFLLVSAEEKSSVVIPTGMLFRNVVNQSWSEPANWNSHEVPGNLEQVVLDSGAVASYTGTDALSLNKLSLKAHAELALQGNMEVLCETVLEISGKLNIGTGVTLQLDGRLLNDGLIDGTTGTGGNLVFSGAGSMQQVIGTGQIAVENLVLDKSVPTAALQLEQPVDVFGYVRTTMGQLHAIGKLTLRHSGDAKQAFLMPIINLADAGVVGEVIVEQHIAGGFPSPATARNWRLLSMPVYHGSGAGAYYHLYDLKAAMFVTGPGGLKNGFDDSPQHGHTVYTHNQSIVGALSQKYTGISVMQTTVDVGRGVYVFSRGSRLVADAQTKQLLTAPFQNPEPYLIQHKGLLFQGDLQVQLQSRNMGESGDGFNLLGNPYAATISWAALQKENLSPYVWKFNPMNNAYDVSDDANTSIAAGEGFFVKVLNGHNSGSLRFTEGAKRSGEISAKGLPGLVSSLPLPATTAEKSVGAKLKLKLVRSMFEQQLSLLLSPEGRDEVDDQDATAMGTGYVSLTSIAAAGTKLSVDTRRQPGRRMLEVPLYVKGYQTGSYELHIAGISSLDASTELTLVDAFLNTTKVLEADQVYQFTINTAVPESFGEHRLSLRLKTRSEQVSDITPIVPDESQVLAYPNPFVSSFKLRIPAFKRSRMEIRLYDLMGRLRLRQDLGPQDGKEEPVVDVSGLVSGIYLMELINMDSGKILKTLKLLKQ